MVKFVRQLISFSIYAITIITCLKFKRHHSLVRILSQKINFLFEKQTLYLCSLTQSAQTLCV